MGDDILRMTRDICDLARKRLPGLEEQVVFPLAIHLNMAMERMRSHGRMVYPGMENIRQQSYEDYEAACYAVDEIQKKYYLTLPEEEKAFLAMYFRKFRKKDMARRGELGCWWYPMARWPAEWPRLPMPSWERNTLLEWI